MSQRFLIESQDKRCLVYILPLAYIMCLSCLFIKFFTEERVSRNNDSFQLIMRFSTRVRIRCRSAYEEGLSMSNCFQRLSINICIVNVIVSIMIHQSSPHRPPSPPRVPTHPSISLLIQTAFASQPILSLPTPPFDFVTTFPSSTFLGLIISNIRRMTNY